MSGENSSDNVPASGSNLRTGAGWLVAAVLLLGPLVLDGLFRLSGTPSEEELLRQGQQAIEENRPAEAVAAAEELLRRNADSVPALELAARAATAREDYSRAVRLLEQISVQGGPPARAAHLEAGRLLLEQLRKPTAAEQHFRQVLKLDPDNVDATYRLAWLLGLCGRTQEAVPHRLKLIRRGIVEPVTLYLLCTGETVLENLPELEELARDAADDPNVWLGQARQAIDQQNDARAIVLLRQVIKARPEIVAAHALLGGVLLETGDTAALREWFSELPKPASDDARVWVVRGSFASQLGQQQAALRCFREAVLRNPNHERANYQLSQLLIAAGRPQDAEPFLNRSRQLEQLFGAVTRAWTGRDMPAVRLAAETARELGLPWEALGWAVLAQERDPHAFWAQTIVRGTQSQLEDLPLTRAAPGVNPAEGLSIENLPLPDFALEDEEAGPGSGGSRSDRTSSTGSIAFVDQAEAAGIVFQYFNGAPIDRQTRRMYEFNGGGVAVLDYDQDGWPDLYLTQGRHWPPGSGTSEYSDRLFRNAGDGTFIDVTAEAGVTDEGFSSGVTAGDFNHDGWPDLYVAAAGANRFLQNNGDGTFLDITDTTATAGNDWSTSCVLADLNSDGLPDLYVVNYLGGDDVFERLCPNTQGQPRSCTPRDFPAAEDRLYLNLGQGQFRDVTREAGIAVPEGKGLGVLAADFSGDGQLELFIANDAVPNFFFVPQPAGRSRVLRFAEQALISGLAMNAAGRSEACMGVAAGDSDGDGLLDLYVTNFHNESNTLYRQQEGGLFGDGTAAAGLQQPSLKLLGFGTQFLDADLDGVLDLIVTNGHIDDLRDTGVPWRMPGQFYRGIGGGRFELLAEGAAGEFFTRPRLGRSLARLDWNRDGREDAVISHLDAPVALLTNSTRPAGNSISLHLRGTRGSRDAIGATVTVHTAERTIVRQLTAGDGYQCSNERMLVVGVGQARSIARLTVQWPGGASQEYRDLPANQELLLIEGREAPVALGALREPFSAPATGAEISP